MYSVRDVRGSCADYSKLVIWGIFGVPCVVMKVRHTVGDVPLHIGGLVGSRVAWVFGVLFVTACGGGSGGGGSAVSEGSGGGGSAVSEGSGGGSSVVSEGFAPFVPDFEAREFELAPLFFRTPPFISAFWWRIGLVPADLDFMDEITPREDLNHFGLLAASFDAVPLYASSGNADSYERFYYGELDNPVSDVEIAGFWDDLRGERGFLRRYETAPIIYLDLEDTFVDAEGYPFDRESELQRMRGVVYDAVQLINAALPDDFQLRISTAFPPGVVQGGILLDFENREGWIRDSSVAGAAALLRLGEDLNLDSAYTYVYVDPGDRSVTRISASNERVLARRVSTNRLRYVVLQQLLMSLGLEGELEDDYASVLAAEVPLSSHGVLGSYDIEGLNVLYSLDTADADVARVLGAWADTSKNIFVELFDTKEVVLPRRRIEMGGVVFGARYSNGRISAWARAEHPPFPERGEEELPLRQAGSLSDEAVWRGYLAGFSPSGDAVRAVTGESRLRVDIESGAGQLDFTQLQSWDASPGMGMAETFLDGALNYQIHVQRESSNEEEISIRRVGGDAGVVTGSFLSDHYNAMGGVLSREDLEAGFGGLRE